MSPGLLIGAYERDNFGDILFLDRARHYLGNREAVATAPVAGDTAELGGEAVRAYSEFLQGDPVPFVWVLGGAVGGTRLSDAMAMNGAPIRPISDIPDFASPYVPRMSRYTATREAKLVVNSVGVAGAARLVGRHRIEFEAALSEANFLSVRDAASSRYLSTRRIRHHLAPDVVHTMALDVERSAVREHDLALLQFKERHIRDIGVPELARILASSTELRGYRIRLFSAGEAPGHDSTELLHELAHAFAMVSAGRTAEVSVTRTAADKAAEISRAGLWAGTSLHGFIISTSYAVPRVGLMIDKVGTYADSWSIDVPTRVQLGSLDEAIKIARGVPDEVMEKDSRRLAEAAHRNVLLAIRSIEDDLQPPDRELSRVRTEAALTKVSPIRTAVESSLRKSRKSLSGARRKMRPVR